MNGAGAPSGAGRLATGVTRAGRRLELDVLRAACTLFIVGYFHVQNFWVASLPRNLDAFLSRLALGLFCFLSGHLLASSYRIEGWRDVRKFYWRRFLRVYPLYLLALAAFLALGLIPPASFLPAAFLVNIYTQKKLLTLWFISLIFLLYALTPLFLWRPSPRKSLLLGAALWTVALASGHFAHSYLAAFTFGVVVAQQPQVRRAIFEPSRATAAGGALLLAGAAFLIVRHRVGDVLPWHRVFGVFVFAGVVPLFTALARRLARIAPVRATVLLSDASYALYLVHRIVYEIGMRLYLPPLRTLQSQLYLLCILLPAAVVAAHWLQRGADRVLGTLFPAGGRRLGAAPPLSGPTLPDGGAGVSP